jgi:hypothetical protein
MDSDMKKKLMAVGAAALGAIIFGESQIIDMEERLKALEDIHPELKQQELDEIAEELQSDEQEASDEDQIEAEEAEAEAQPLIEADKE